ncbi:MAG: polysaccharide deacetylase family protein [Bacteroidales bacterium]|jgi:polysaccharide deacetylase family protein (PEP-CTERM system associated)|nr:polysaccharide deacetylase family protein [Bacteroidales bacterium]
MNVLTFDIEEWFHLLDGAIYSNSYESRLKRNTDTILEILEKHNTKATFFIIGSVAKQYPDVVKTIAAKYEIGSHSMNHKLVYTMKREAFRVDLQDSIHTLEDITGKKIKYYRAPGLSIHKEQIATFDIMAENGIEIDSSLTSAHFYSYGRIKNIPQEPFLIKRQGFEIKEFPVVSKYPILFSVGGYFRLFGYKAIKKMTQNSKYITSYFHPRDFDAGQPMLQGLSLLRRFKSYYGLKQTKGKLDKWLTDFNFIDLDMASQSIDWLKVPVVNL